MNGTLSVAQTEWVDSHLPTCVQCQEALEVLRAVQHQCLNDAVAIGDVEAGLTAMNQRLDRFLAGGQVQSRSRVSSSGAMAQWLRRNFRPASIGLVFTCVLVACVGVFTIYNQHDRVAATQVGNYKTLSDVQASLPVVPAKQQLFRVLFHRDTTDARMQAIFNRFQAQVVAGPTAKGIYTIAVPAQKLEPREIATLLRGESEVLVAEWINEL